MQDPLLIALIAAVGTIVVAMVTAYATPLLGKARARFQTEAVIQRLFNVGNLTSVTSFTGAYGAGGTLLHHNGVDYIGAIFRWKFIELI